MTNNNSLPIGFDKLKIEKPYINLGKLAEGEYRYRIVERPIAGWIDWKDKKPCRFRPDAKPLAAFDSTKPIKPFWAIHVWDYAKEGLYIMEVTQNSIRKALEMLALNEDWGDLTTFDFKIKKEGVGIDTSYSVIPIPPKPMNDSIKQCVASTKMRLEALYDGLDPWNDLEAPAVNTKTGEVLKEPELDIVQRSQIESMIKQINDPTYVKQLEDHLKVSSIYKMHPERDYKRAIRSLEQRMQSRSSKTHDQPAA